MSRKRLKPMANEHKLLNAILRTDLHAFIRKSFEELNPGNEFLDNWHLRAIAWHLAQFAEKKIKRLIINLPPRNLKSISASVALPAWILGRNPSAKLVCVSYSELLATKFGRDCERVMEAPWYSKAFPKSKIKRATSREIELYGGGSRLATSVGGGLTGLGGSNIIIDDPIKAGAAMSEVERHSVIEWYRNTVFSRLDNKKEDGILLVMQRMHVEDLAGFFLEQGGWTLLSLPAIATEDQIIRISDTEKYSRREGELLHEAHEDETVLNEAKYNLGSAAFNSQYQQQPVPASGNMILRDWFKFYQEKKRLDWFEFIVQSWDTASGTGENNSYSACLTFGIRENRYYLLNVFRARLNFPQLEAQVEKHARTWGADHVLIEKAASGYQLLDSLFQKTSLPLIPIPPDSDKVTRVMRVSSYIEAGRVFLPAEEPWLGEFMSEILSFPHGKFDDQVDAFAHFLFWTIARDRPQPESRFYGFGGGDQVRDRYRERVGISGFPEGW